MTQLSTFVLRRLIQRTLEVNQSMKINKIMPGNGLLSVRNNGIDRLIVNNQHIRSIHVSMKYLKNSGKDDLGNLAARISQDSGMKVKKTSERVKKDKKSSVVHHQLTTDVVCAVGNYNGDHLDICEDSLSDLDLNYILGTSINFKHENDDLLKNALFRDIQATDLIECDAKVTTNNSGILFPLKSREGQVVGFEIVSLGIGTLGDAGTQVTRKYITNRSVSFHVCNNALTNTRSVVAVPGCIDVLKLRNCDTNAISLPCDISAAVADVQKLGYTEVIFWLGEKLSKEMVVAFEDEGILCSLIRSSPSLMLLKENLQETVATCLQSRVGTKSYLQHLDTSLLMTDLRFKLRKPDLICTLEEMKENIFHRLTHPDEISGTAWHRFAALNRIFMGHRAGEMTVVTGTTGCGKTTLLSEYSLDLCLQGVPTLWCSYEVNTVRLCEIMMQQYNGAPLPREETAFMSLCREFLTLPMYFLNCNDRKTTKQLVKDLAGVVKYGDIKHVIIDNLQFMLGMQDQGSDRWWQQDVAVGELRQFATSCNCHVTLIVHPKKVPSGQALEIGSVMGGAKVTQEADNVMILQVFNGKRIRELQVVKNRHNGELGKVPLLFHKNSLTFSSFFSSDKPTKRVPSHTK